MFRKNARRRTFMLVCPSLASEVLLICIIVSYKRQQVRRWHVLRRSGAAYLFLPDNRTRNGHQLEHLEVSMCRAFGIFLIFSYGSLRTFNVFCKNVVQ
eukprot:CCRYP_004990-RA/>CCRYP_004990-RA protein AED:0.34 eAED:0.34 QI:253/1/1/1/0/0/3/2293/97